MDSRMGIELNNWGRLRCDLCMSNLYSKGPRASYEIDHLLGISRPLGRKYVGIISLHKIIYSNDTLAMGTMANTITYQPKYRQNEVINPFNRVWVVSPLIFGIFPSLQATVTAVLPHWKVKDLPTSAKSMDRQIMLAITPIFTLVVMAPTWYTFPWLMTAIIGFDNM